MPLSGVQTTREQLLHLLLENKGGLTVEEMASALQVSRNAVRQHLSGLENDNLVAAANVRRGIGRPSRVYTLTRLGVEQFPKQYSMLSSLMLSSMRSLYGDDGPRRLLQHVAAGLAADLAPQVNGASAVERLRAVVEVLNKLEYSARADVRDGQMAITTINCVFHHLAPQFREVCQFDQDLISRLVGERVDHAECMARGGSRCRFVLRQSRA